MPCWESHRCVPLTREFCPAFWMKWVRKTNPTNRKSTPRIGIKVDDCGCLRFGNTAAGAAFGEPAGLSFEVFTFLGAGGSASLEGLFVSPEGFLKSHRRALKSQLSFGGFAETTGLFKFPPRRRSSSLRAEAQRFRCRATIRRSRAERVSPRYPRKRGCNCSHSFIDPSSLRGKGAPLGIHTIKNRPFHHEPSR